ncbi:MAG: type II secretion system F family protein [Myxococcota bacterium]
MLASASLFIFLTHRLVLERRAVLRLGGEGASVAGEDDLLPAEPTVRHPIRWQSVFLSVRLTLGLSLGVGLFGAGIVAWFAAFELPIASAIGFDIGVLVYLALSSQRAKYMLRLEAQLAETLRLTSAALKAGLGRIDALHRASEQVSTPLRPILQETVGRLRLGESAEDAFERLVERVPLETFRLFSMVVATQWQAGGSLQGTLASVGDFMQDRVDVQQRIASQSAPTRSSTFVLFAATGAIAYFSWTHDPFSLERFLRSDAGTALVATTLALQGVALIWMDRLMRGTE